MDKDRKTVGGLRGWAVASLAVLTAATIAGCGSSHATGQDAGAAVTLKPVVASIPPSLFSGSAKPSASAKPAKASASPSVSSTHATVGAKSSASSKPTTANSSPATSTSHGSAACVSSAAKANCGPFSYPKIQGTSSNPTVGNNVWAPISGWQQTLYANSPGDWSVAANMPAGNTAVVSYPSSGSNYGDRKLSSFSAMRSSFSEDMNSNSGTSAWAAYDIWLNGGSNEVMIQHDFANNGACGPNATATFGGSGGVPTHGWYLCQFGSELVWKLSGGNQSSGSVDILAMLTWLENHGYLPKSSTLASIGYGWEICSTGGRAETFKVSGYSITTS